MRRTNSVEVVAEGPDRGLITSVPSDLPDKTRNRALVVAKNVRAEYGVLRAAPGYERVLFNPRGLDSAPNLIFQSNILNGDAEIRTTPIIGTDNSLYVLQRRAADLVCAVDGSGSGFTCPLTVGFLGDSGRVGSNLEAVADLIKGWSPDLIIHTGDMTYSDGGTSSTINDFEESIGQYFAEYIGGYNGIYGVGPAANKFFPTLGNHDWDDGGINNYYDFFQLPNSPNERYFSYKRGPVHFVHLSGYSSQEPDGIDESSDQAVWARDVLGASDCPWRIVVVHFPPWSSEVGKYPGETDLRWIADVPGVTAIVCGHAHCAEVVQIGDIYQFVTGTGGYSLRGFAPVPIAGSQWRYNADYGALRLRATNQSCTWEYFRKDGELLHTVEQTEPKSSSGVCYIGDAARQVFTLEVVPSTAAVEVGYQWSFEAIAHYEDGTSENVTLQSDWRSGDPAIATVNVDTGVATGVSPGTAQIHADFRGETAYGYLAVLRSCLDDPLDVVWCVERSESTGSTSSGASRLQHIKNGIASALQGFDSDRDKMALVSFAGTYVGQAEDATLDQVLTSDFSEFQDKVNVLASSGTGAGVAAALDEALAELQSARHGAERKRTVILIVDGPPTVSAGGDTSSEAAAIADAFVAAKTAAQALKDEDTLIAVIGYAVPEEYDEDYREIATDQLYFPCDTAEQFLRDIAIIANSFCVIGGPYYYYVSPPVSCTSAELSYTGFINWDVIRNDVDLQGVGTNGRPEFDYLPGNGLYVDLQGTAPGKMRSKTTYNFTSGKTYRLSMDLAGWQAGESRISFTVTTSIENALTDQVTTFTDKFQPFTTYSWEFTPSSNVSGRIIIDEDQVGATGAPYSPYSLPGILMDRVKLENVTDGTTMLYDDFDGENNICPV